MPRPLVGRVKSSTDLYPIDSTISQVKNSTLKTLKIYNLKIIEKILCKKIY